MSNKNQNACQTIAHTIKYISASNNNIFETFIFLYVCHMSKLESPRKFLFCGEFLARDSIYAECTICCRLSVCPSVCHTGRNSRMVEKIRKTGRQMDREDICKSHLSTVTHNFPAAS